MLGYVILILATLPPDVDSPCITTTTGYSSQSHFVLGFQPYHYTVFHYRINLMAQPLLATGINPLPSSAGRGSIPPTPPDIDYPPAHSQSLRPTSQIWPHSQRSTWFGLPWPSFGCPVRDPSPTIYPQISCRTPPTLIPGAPASTLFMPSSSPHPKAPSAAALLPKPRERERETAPDSPSWDPYPPELNPAATRPLIGRD